MTVPTDPRPNRGSGPTATALCRRVTGLVALALLVAGCAAAPMPDAASRPQTVERSAASTDRPGRLPFAQASPHRRWPRTVVTEPPPIPPGNFNNPFSELPPTNEALAVRTPRGVVLPVIDERDSSWLVITACQDVRFVSEATPIGRAHVVLDPGHGGREVGATGSTGLTEADLNLRVATMAATLLEQAGATVVLTRSGDYTVTPTTRGLIAEAIQPGLFVSIHHNGGAPADGERPGTLVYTKSGSPASTRFGGLLHQTLQPMLIGAAEPKREAYRVYDEALDDHETRVAAYDRDLAARDAALVANGQLPPEATTTIAPATPVGPGEARLPSLREPVSTTTVPPTAEQTVPVPDHPAVPEPFELDPVRPFRWAGSANAGVRSWVRADGKDYLAVLRHSGEVPAVLAEFAFITNPAEEELLADPRFVEREAGVLADAIILFFTTDSGGTGHVRDQVGEQTIGGGTIDSCTEPEL